MSATCPCFLWPLPQFSEALACVAGHVEQQDAAARGSCLFAQGLPRRAGGIVSLAMEESAGPAGAAGPGCEAQGDQGCPLPFSTTG